jgi:N-acetylglutamate synthase-like GNAT family acetyltransferase
MTVNFKIHQLTEANYDAKKLAPLLKKSQSEGFNLVLRLIENWDNGKNRFNQPGEAFYIAEHEGRYLGCGGRSIDPYSNDPEVIRIRHVYVLTDWRRFGIASAIMKRIMHMPPGMFKKATLRTLNPAARKFYETLGFTYIGEGDVTHEMVLPLEQNKEAEGAGR